MLVGPESSLRPPLRLWRTLKAALFGGTLGGLGLALLILRINPTSVRDVGTSLPLVLWFVVVGCALSALVACSVFAVVRLLTFLLSRLTGARTLEAKTLKAGLAKERLRGEGNVAAALSILLAFGPITYVLLLPEAGLAGSFLTDRIAAGALQLLISLFLLCAILVVFGLLLRSLCVGRSWSITWLSLTVAVLWLFTLVLTSQGQARTKALQADVPPALPRSHNLPPVVLLCIDGADPRVLDRLIEQGQLPAFAELKRRGTFGPLESFVPTLSPAIWTTMITGQTSEVHGIFGFTRYRLPGISQPLDRFPMHAGLNFELPKLIEKIPGAPAPRVPYTRFDRAAPTVWQIHQYMNSKRSPSGVFQWRVTWPAEKLKGFMVAARVTLGEVQSAGRVHDPLLNFSRPGVMNRARRAAEMARRSSADDVLAYLDDPEQKVALDDPRLQIVKKSLDYVALAQLTALLHRHQPQLLVAGFYSVDAFNHMFWSDARDGGEFSPAIDERYRFTDARLGELLAELPENANVIVVSDHGFNFEHGHHTHAPPGVFLAAGPAFAEGRQVEGASVYDIGPLLLHLLGLPPGEDMPGTRSYRQLLDIWAALEEVGTVPSWQGLMSGLEQTGSSPVEDDGAEAVLEELRTLGYIE